MEITRSLARHFRAVARQCLPPRSLQSPAPPTLTLTADSDGLRLQVDLGDVAVAYHQPGQHAPATLALPLTALEDFEGRCADKVALEVDGTEKVTARWNEGVVARDRTYQLKEDQQPRPFPSLPQHLKVVSPSFLQALDEARRSTAKDSARYALTRIQLRGKGEIVASDGRQLLIQSCFDLPWQDDVLIPALPVFGSRELAQVGTIRIGKTDSHVCLQTGPWTFLLRIDRDGRYPRVEDVIPRPGRNGTMCRLDPEDATFLRQTFARLIDPKDEDQSLTLDLNGRVVVRSRSEGQDRPTEVVLERSTASGPAVRVATNGRYLKRALELGLTELHIAKADAPVLAEAKGLRYVWMPLTGGGVVMPTPDTQCIGSSAGDSKVAPLPRRAVTRKIPVRQPQRQPIRLTPPPPVPASKPKPEATTSGRGIGVWEVLCALFAPRGWLWRRSQTTASVVSPSPVTVAATTPLRPTTEPTTTTTSRKEGQ